MILPQTDTKTSPEFCEKLINCNVNSRLSLLQEGAIYATGMFSHSMRQMSVVLIPLWAVFLDATPFMIGIIIGARSVLPIFFSIHGGAMMDRYGARRVLIAAAALAVLLPLLFPAAPWIVALVIFQLVAGLAENIGVLGAHTMVGQYAKGSASHAGRLTFVTYIGQFSGPPLVGVAWDLWGPWGAFGFLCLWATCGLIAATLLPRSAAVKTTPHERVEPSQRFSLSSLLPRAGDYNATMKLLLTIGVAVVLTVTGMRYVGVAVQGSFYVVFLEQMGITGTAIGLLLTAAGLLAAGGSVLAGWLSRVVGPLTLLFGSVALSVALICVTPLFGSYLALVIASSLRGASMGISSAVSLSALSGMVPAEIQGKAFGLRMTVNRSLSAALPIIMGALVQFTGIETAFYIVGVSALLVLAVTALIAGHITERPSETENALVQPESLSPAHPAPAVTTSGKSGVWTA